MSDTESGSVIIRQPQLQFVGLVKDLTLQFTISVVMAETFSAVIRLSE